MSDHQSMLDASKKSPNRLSLHDELLIKDLGKQKPWMILLYFFVGALSLLSGFYFDSSVSNLLCAGGGFLTALAIEKSVTRKVRMIALQLIHLIENPNRQ